MLGHNGVAGRKCHLMLNVNQPGGCITEDGAPVESVMFWLSASRVDASASYPGFELVAEDSVAWLQLFLL